MFIICTKDKVRGSRFIAYLLKVFLQFLDASHVILIFNAEDHGPGISTSAFELEGARVSVDVVHQELGCVLSQQAAKQISTIRVMFLVMSKDLREVNKAYS